MQYFCVTASSLAAGSEIVMTANNKTFMHTNFEYNWLAIRYKHRSQLVGSLHHQEETQRTQQRTMTLRQILNLVLLFRGSPLFFKAAMDRIS